MVLGAERQFLDHSVFHSIRSFGFFYLAGSNSARLASAVDRLQPIGDILFTIDYFLTERQTTNRLQCKDCLVGVGIATEPARTASGYSCSTGGLDSSMETDLFSADATPAGNKICPEAQTIEELGLPPSMVIDLALRLLKEQGSGSLTTLRRCLKLSYPIADAIFQHLRQNQLIDVKGTAGSDYVFSLTASARTLATERSQECRYAGPAPVPVAQYSKVIQLQRMSLQPTPEQLRQVFADLVLAQDILDQLGASLVSGRPVFLYGPSGNGKTSIIHRLSGLFDDSVLVPYCVEVDGHIISVFDPSVHLPVDWERYEQVDQRWIRCRRPCVIAGAELVPELLSLRMDVNSGLYAAPLQMKAANGIFAIDDFGRQPIPAASLFNRWILPLDRRLDNLSLQYGFMVQVPFEVILVFSTNLRPSELADEAFIRRVPNKIYLPSISPEAFDEIFKRVLLRQGIPFKQDLAAHLRGLCRQHGVPDLRACYPSDICEILAALAVYERIPFTLSAQNLARAAHLYFLHTAPTEKSGDSGFLGGAGTGPETE